MKSVLITGGAGFIGSHLCDAMLERGWRVTALDNFSPFYDPACKRDNLAGAVERGATVLEADVTRPADLNDAFEKAQPNVVVHLAACAGVRPSIADPAQYVRVNVLGTQCLVDAARQHGTERVIVAGSSSVYGNNRKVPFAEEDDVSSPISPYAATKVSTELVCKVASHLHGLPITALRFFTVFGPRQRPDLAIRKFMTLLSRGEPITLFGDGSTSRDYTYIDDIIDGVLRAIEGCGRVAPFRIYNLGGEHPVTLADLVEAIEHTTGHKARVQRLPEQPGDVRRTWADLSRSRDELGYEPKTLLEEGLSRQWEWLQADPRRTQPSSSRMTSSSSTGAIV